MCLCLRGHEGLGHLMMPDHSFALGQIEFEFRAEGQQRNQGLAANFGATSRTVWPELFCSVGKMNGIGKNA